jgi:hypothetical protein
VLDRKTAADIYLGILVEWERTYKDLPQIGNFDIRSKEFSAFKRTNSLEVLSYENATLSDEAISSRTELHSQPKQIVLFQKGSNSRARGLFKHIRNSIAHSHVERVKIKNKWFICFSAKNDKGKQVLHAQLIQNKLTPFISALKSTVKSV